MLTALALPTVEEEEPAEAPAPEEIRAARMRLNLTKAQAAELVGLPVETTWHRYETGYYRMPLDAWLRFQAAIRDGRAQASAARRAIIEQEDDETEDRAQRAPESTTSPHADAALEEANREGDREAAQQAWIDHLRRCAASRWEPRSREENRQRQEARVRQGHLLRDRIKTLGVPTAPLARAVFADHPDPVASWKSVLAGARVLTPQEAELVEAAIRRLTRAA